MTSKVFSLLCLIIIVIAFFFDKIVLLIDKVIELKSKYC
ncbi:hypothetical protein [uncultured Gammaproteobacteria bacterium]|nr:hypothetical protein BROOK1789C_2218 [Bathymodiolus brooksi thiotrophic gill symbiont]CAC9594792.1 hypothetical protein [uncultured Gammaproteobacteria bacterium]CAC9953036.1 hypothetical protein [uncultured Gammaproteobacteria bacterium]CAC9957263.1 hypothetical protein [uncultured Gammaproteobacteria bacterium]CAC9961420.1 hypothetical protein [uncultured Gammaproteobacteria bacterium]